MAVFRTLAGDRKNAFLLCFLLIFFAATWKYVKDGDAYIFQTPVADQFIDLRENVVSQEIIVDDMAKWSDKSYAVFFHFENGVDAKSEERIRLEISKDDEMIDFFDLPIRWLREGFNELKWIDFSGLKAGKYQLALSGTPNQPISVGICKNIYNIPDCYANGKDTGYTLAQTYHYNYADLPYKVGIILYLLLVAMSVATFWLCVTRGENAAGVIRVTLIATYIILAYEYSSIAFYQPTYAEAITNFMHNSINQSWWRCLLASDAGYLPLVQRLIAIFAFNFMNLSPYVGVFVMQMAAYLVTGTILSFFAKKQFSSVLDIRMRWMFSVMLMMLVLGNYGYEASYFINFMVHGAYVFFLYFLIDSGEWSKGEFLFVSAWVFAQCLSKGISVTLLPFCVICFVLFRRSYSRRDRIMLSSCALGALLQITYYLLYGVHLVNWADRANSAGSEFYYAKLLCGILVDTPNWLLSPLADKVTVLNGISIPIVILFWGLVAYGFIKNVIAVICKGFAVRRETVVFFMAIMFIMIHSLFLRITILGPRQDEIASDAFWTFQNFSIDRHTMPLLLAAALAYIVFLHGFESRWSDRKNMMIWTIAMVAMCVVCPRMQLKGLGGDSYARGSSYGASINCSEVSLLKGIQEAECRLVPILHPINAGSRYGKNVLCYCFGQDVFGWGFPTTGSDEPQRGELVLGNFSNIDTSAPIWQLFVAKNCLVNASEWRIILYDEQGEIIEERKQDNTKYQKMASFTFDEGIADVDRIRVVDDDGNQVCMENSIYVVTKAGEPLIK